MENIDVNHMHKILTAALNEKETLKKDFLIQSVLNIVAKEKTKEKEYI